MSRADLVVIVVNTFVFCFIGPPALRSWGFIGAALLCFTVYCALHAIYDWLAAR